VNTSARCISLLALAIAATSTALAQEWKPTKNVEIVSAAGAGGSADRGSRVAQKYLSALPGMPSVTVNNRQGGAGTLAWTYIAQHPGDAHYLGTLSPGLITNELLGTSTLSYRDFTPLALLMREYIVMSVKADSPLTSAKDLAARMKKDPQSVTYGFASALGNQNHVVIGMIARAAGVDPKAAKVVVFNSGSLAATAMLGGHIDVLVGTPGTVLPHLTEGRARALGVSGPDRIKHPGYAAVPTFREQGVDAVYYSWRGFLSAKSITPAQVSFWEQAFAKVAQEPEWKEDYEKNAWTEDFRRSTETRKHLDAESALLRKLLGELGLIK